MSDNRGAGRLLYSITDAADLISCKRTSIYNWLASGELESIKLGRRRLITAESISAMIQRQLEKGRVGA